MKPVIVRAVTLFAAAVLMAALVSRSALADPSKYPQFAQQKLPDNITPSFISIDELIADVRTGRKPLIIDVRTGEEYREAHIISAVSAPLAEFKGYVKSIPRDRPVILY
ncbi:MAG: rhodanese-like domain-containing protein [Candidatus Angelobacter sp.]